MHSSLAPLLALLEVRLASGRAFSEYDLLRWLQEPEQCIFSKEALNDSKNLFQSHFLLMHALYLLREQWAQNKQAWLEISALCIQKSAWQESPQATTNNLSQADPLALYYLDFANFDTSTDEIDQMLNRFWKLMLQPDSQEQDLAILELAAPATGEQIKRQYRKLAMQHHPDRGGEQQKFCAIQAAFQRLKGQYQCD